jgi:hypothetical protein
MHSYRMNAGRRMRWVPEEKRSVPKEGRPKPHTPYELPAGFLFSMDRDELVALRKKSMDDDPATVMAINAEFERRGRDPDHPEAFRKAWLNKNPIDALMNPSEEHKQILIGAAIGFALCWFTKDSIKARMNP